MLSSWRSQHREGPHPLDPVCRASPGEAVGLRMDVELGDVARLYAAVRFARGCFDKLSMTGVWLSGMCHHA